MQWAVLFHKLLICWRARFSYNHTHQDFKLDTSQRLSEKLKALGVKTGAATVAPPKPKSTYGVDSVVDGAFYPTLRGEVFVVDQVYRPDYLHGESPLLPF